MATTIRYPPYNQIKRPETAASFSKLQFMGSPYIIPQYRAITNRYRHINCNGPSFDSLYPGFDDLTTQLPEFNDQISSWQCYGRLPALNGPVPIK